MVFVLALVRVGMFFGGDDMPVYIVVEYIPELLGDYRICSGAAGSGLMRAQPVGALLRLSVSTSTSQHTQSFQQSLLKEHASNRKGVLIMV